MFPSSRFKKVALLLVILLLPGLLFFLISRGDHNFKTLPVFGPKMLGDRLAHNESTDTVYHTIPEFSFVNQDGVEISKTEYEGKIYIANFFFTRCPSICPMMTSQLVRLQWQLEDPDFEDVWILSHSVDPEFDTPEVLKKYTAKYGANIERWNFVTGDKEEIYTLGRGGYFLSAQEDGAAPGGYLHSEMLVLVDRKGRIRGYYDGTNTEQVDLLVDDIKMLLKEDQVQ